MKRFHFVLCLSLAGGALAASLPSDGADQPGGWPARITRPTTFPAPVVHRGKLRVVDTTVRFLSSYTEHGAYLSDPSTTYFTDLTVGPNGYLTGGAGDVFVVSGNFTNGSTQKALWNTIAAELDFSGTGAHTFELAGADVGADYAGFAQNFAWSALRLGGGQRLILGDGNAMGGAALYVNRLILDGGASQMANITGNGASIYYDSTDSANAYLLAGAPGGIYALAGGGAVRPAQAVLKILSTAKLTNGHILIQGKGVPGRSHALQATADLQNAPFAPLAAVVADANGNLQYEDANAASFQRRFYRFIFP